MEDWNKGGKNLLLCMWRAMIKLLFLTMTLSRKELSWFYLRPGLELPKGAVIMWFLHRSWGIQGSDKRLGMDLGINVYKHTQVSCQSSWNYFVPRWNIKKKSHLTYPKTGPSTSLYLEGSVFSPINICSKEKKKTHRYILYMEFRVKNHPQSYLQELNVSIFL